jgi:hypothetical protein
MASLIALFALGIWVIVRYFDELDSYRAAGVWILALLFYLLSMIGLYPEMADRTTVQGIGRTYAKFWVVIGLVVGTFCGGAWALLVGLTVLMPSWMPGWIQYLIFMVAFLGFVSGLIKLYMRSADLIGEWLD